jgi:hypothetical protein
VTEHHTFRTAGGAARIEDGCEIAGRRHGIRHRPARSYQRFVPEHSIRYGVIVRVNQHQATRRICCKRHSGYCESIIDDEQLGAAIAQGIRVFLDTPADVEGYYYGARPTGGQVALNVTILVEHEDRNAIAAAEAMGAQRPRYA